MVYINKHNTLSILLTFMLLLSGCKGDKPKEQHQNQEINPENLKKQFIKANQQLVQKESDEMDYYAKSHQMPFITTTSGIRYYVYESSTKGDSIKSGMLITMDFRVSLLNGTEVYSSKESGKKTFKVGSENIESGIQRGLQYIKHGDKALFLIPSHLAHGLFGDSKKIPPQMPIVYDVQIN
jgi:FKBP-type peptidyl-prolyl cis-trans isomerase FkpA